MSANVFEAVSVRICPKILAKAGLFYTYPDGTPWRQVLQVARYPSVLCVVPEAVQAEVVQVVREKRPTTRYLLKSWERFLGTDSLSGWREPLAATDTDLMM
ncbi:MAG: hypothetical protein IPM76_21730 [Chloroflexi bacterium]|nr:hypothetical protein [Chloroflexota bacterium]